MKRLLGIDIDGVFNIMSLEDKENEINRTPVYYLNKIMEHFPDCDILITSAWGNPNNKTVDALVEAGFEYANRVVGATRFGGSTQSRTQEVINWLAKRNELNYYDIEVYLDDEIELFEYFGEHANRSQVVHCRGDRGLDIDKAYETIAKLHGADLKFWG